MSEGTIRINKVLREFNISLERAVDYLKDKGHVIESNPNTKISDEVYNVLSNQFAGDKGNKDASKEVGEEKRKEKEALRVEREHEIEEKRKSFQKTIDLTYTKVYNNQSAENVSKSVIEAVLIGVNKNAAYIDSITVAEAQALLEKLRQDRLFSVESLKEGLAQKAKVTGRINKAIEIFSGN